MLMLSSLLWGASFIFTKGLFLTEPHITPFLIVTGRLLIATACFVPFLLVTHRLEPIRKGDLPMFLLLSFFEPFLYSILETTGVNYVSASLASIIVATIPLFVPFGVALAYRERLRLLSVLGVALSLVGVFVMVAGPQAEFGASGRGVACLSGAVVIAVGYTLVLSKILKRYRPVTITAYQNLISLVYFVPVILIFDTDALPLLSYSWGMWGRLAFLGLLCSTLAYVFYNYGMRAMGPTAASVYNNLIPVVSLLLAVAIGQERLTLSKVVGMAVVIMGLFLAQRRNGGSGQ